MKKKCSGCNRKISYDKSRTLFFTGFGDGGLPKKVAARRFKVNAVTCDWSGYPPPDDFPNQKPYAHFHLRCYEKMYGRLKLSP